MTTISILLQIIVIIGITLSEVSAKRISIYPNSVQIDWNENITKRFCIFEFVLDKKQSTLPVLRNKTYEITNFFNLHPRQLCDEKSHQYFEDSIVDRFVLINISKECDINRQINNFRNKSINGLIVLIGCEVDITQDINITEETLLNNNFSISLCSEPSFRKLLNTSASNETLKIFDISFERELDLPGAGIIWCLATFATVVGGFWSGSVRLKNYLAKATLPSNRSLNDLPEEINDPEDELKIIWKHIEQIDDLIIVGVVLTYFVLFTLLFQIHYLIVLFIIGLIFIPLSIISFFKCLEPIFERILPERLSEPIFPFTNVVFYKMILFIFGVFLTFICQNKRQPWKINDFLEVCVCVFTIKLIRLPSLRISLIYLWSFLAIDVFTVFIIPLLSKGNTLMADDAHTNPNYQCGKVDLINMFFLRVPRPLFQTNVLERICNLRSETTFSFVNIVIPGLMIGFCYSCDLFFNIEERIYFVMSSLGYGLGLIFTYIAQSKFGTTQPALLYIVPCVSVLPLIIGFFSNELDKLWIGPEEWLRINDKDLNDLKDRKLRSKSKPKNNVLKEEDSQ